VDLMRVAIIDPDSDAVRRLDEALERFVPDADVLHYDDADAALTSCAEQRPDVVFVAPTVGTVSGPELVARLRDVVDATVVGVVGAPDASASERYIAAGAHVVAAQPVDDLAIRAALRQSGGGIPG
jgi:CheY-like chemotaxis protein